MHGNLSVVVSTFNDQLGPVPIVTFPESDPMGEFDNVALTTFDIMQDSNQIPESMICVPFPTINKRGLVKFAEWTDSSKRGGKRDITFTLVIEERDDPILYKYQADLERLAEKFTKNFFYLMQNRASNEELRPHLASFLKDVSDLLEQLASHELLNTEKPMVDLKITKHLKKSRVLEIKN